LLDKDGWRWNEAGEAFVPGTDALRYRKGADGTLTPLRLRMAAPDENEVSDAIMALYGQTLPGLGVELELTKMPFSDFLSHYTREAGREYDLFFMGSNFSYVFDPYYDFHTGNEYQGMVNTTGLRDEELMRLALRMRNTTPGDRYTYARRWLDFQRRFVEVMPVIPLYSNNYYDFYDTRIRNYVPSEFVTWSMAILDAYVSETPD